MGSVASGLCLLLAPEEPSTYSGGNFVLYPAVALFMTALAALLASFVGCWGVVRDTKMALYVVRAWSSAVALYGGPEIIGCVSIMIQILLCGAL